MALPQNGQGAWPPTALGADPPSATGAWAAAAGPPWGTGVGIAFLAPAAALDKGLPQSMQYSAPGSLARPQKAQVVTGGASPRAQKLWRTNLLRKLASRKGRD